MQCNICNCRGFLISSRRPKRDLPINHVLLLFSGRTSRQEQYFVVVPENPFRPVHLAERSICCMARNTANNRRSRTRARTVDRLNPLCIDAGTTMEFFSGRRTSARGSCFGYNAKKKLRKFLQKLLSLSLPNLVSSTEVLSTNLIFSKMEEHNRKKEIFLRM